MHTHTHAHITEYWIYFVSLYVLLASLSILWFVYTNVARHSHERNHFFSQMSLYLTSLTFDPSMLVYSAVLIQHGVQGQIIRLHYLYIYFFRTIEMLTHYVYDTCYTLIPVHSFVKKECRFYSHFFSFSSKIPFDMFRFHTKWAFNFFFKHRISLWSTL